MGEIRSALDIIMEKAKNLEVTQEEKTEIRRKEIEAKAKGMVQRFLDGAVRLEDLTGEISNMDEQGQEWVKEAIKNDCMERINIEKGNKDILELLEKVVGMSTEPISSLIKEFQNKLSQEIERVRGELAQGLQEKGIKGSAVIANHKAWPHWSSLEKRLQNEFRKQLGRLY